MWTMALPMSHAAKGKSPMRVRANIPFQNREFGSMEEGRVLVSEGNFRKRSLLAGISVLLTRLINESSKISGSFCEKSRPSIVGSNYQQVAQEAFQGEKLAAPELPSNNRI